MYALFAFLGSCVLALLSWLLCVMALKVWHKQPQNKPPALVYSDIRPLKTMTHFGKAALPNLPYLLLLAALATLLLAWWNPALPLTHTPSNGDKKQLPPLPSEGTAFYLLLDVSSSMSQNSPLTIPIKRKIDLLKQATMHLIDKASSTSSDLIGIIAFARSAQVLSPLTLDYKRLQEVLGKLDVVQKEEEDGTGIGYAIFKAVELIAATRQIAEGESKNRPHFQIQKPFLVVLTDGFQEPNPKDSGKRLRTMGLQEAAEHAKKEGVTLYVINMEPSLEKATFAPHRRLLDSITKLTGGEFFLLSQASSLDQLYETISKKEKALLSLGFVDTKESSAATGRKQSPLTPYLLLLACLFLAAAACALSTSHRTLP